MNYYKLIKSLIAEIRRLRQENSALQEAEETYSSWQHRMEQKNRQLRDENQRMERDADIKRYEQQSKDWEREELMKKLERQERSGDTWGVDRTKKSLKNL